MIGREAVAAVRRSARGERPLFMFVGFNAPHAPSTPDPRDAGAFASLSPSRSPAVNERDVSDKPSFIRERPPLDPAAMARIASRRQSSLEALLGVDRQVARLVAELRRQGELGETYLLYTSDNGELAGEHRIEFGKLLAYDPSSRVPLLVRGPGIPKGVKSGELAGNVDLAPTIVELAGAEPTLALDGRSLLPYLLDPARRSPRPLLIESLVRDRSTYYGHPYRAIRTRRYLYVEYATGERELYDASRDPFQLDSRARDPRYAATRGALAAALAGLDRCTGSACRPRLERIPSPAVSDGSAAHPLSHTVSPELGEDAQ